MAQEELIGAYLDGIPSMSMAEAHPAKTINEILEINLRDETSSGEVI